MPITFKGIDIINMIKKGSNSSTRNIAYGDALLKGAPQGADPAGEWDVPHPFGISIGGRDLCYFYMAEYRDHDNSQDNISIPDGVNALKIFCIGGGGGGSGGNSGHRNQYRAQGSMNWNFNYNYYDAWHNPSNGNIGAYGQYGQYTTGELNRNANTYNVQIGNGGGGGDGGNFRNGGIGNPGSSGGRGNDTVANLGGGTVVGSGGNGGYGTNDNRGSSTTNPAYTSPGGLPRNPNTIQGGDCGNTSTGNGGGGRVGSKGFCRVYFLY